MSTVPPKPVRIEYRFVGWGATAPDPLPPGEIWIDVGNRTGPGVLDHHGGQAGARSSCELVFKHYREWVLAPVHGMGKVTLVLHRAPDLDAIGAAWLARWAIATGEMPAPQSAVERMVSAISAHDQGYLIEPELPANWPLIMRTRLTLEEVGKDDEAKLSTGMELLDATLVLLRQGRTLAAAARELVTPATGDFLDRAQGDYGEDLARGTVFQTYLPVHTGAASRKPLANVPLDPPGDNTPRRLVDGLHVMDPRSALLKELARGDREHSPQRQGFALLVVSRAVPTGGYPVPLYRHIISTDPRSETHLKRLGKQLEALEQTREGQAGVPLLKGRERVPPGTGRHGYNVPSPWYDGRGHEFTIVDSPSVTLPDGTVTCASCLTPAEVLEVVRGYGGVR